MDREVFLDTSYAIALASEKDEFHHKAQQLAQERADSGSKVVTTRAVLLEIGNALSRLRYRQAAVKLIDALEADPDIGIVPSPSRFSSKRFNFFANGKIRNGAWSTASPLSSCVNAPSTAHSPPMTTSPKQDFAFFYANKISLHAKVYPTATPCSRTSTTRASTTSRSSSSSRTSK